MNSKTSMDVFVKIGTCLDRKFLWKMVKNRSSGQKYITGRRNMVLRLEKKDRGSTRMVSLTTGPYGRTFWWKNYKNNSNGLRYNRENELHRDLKRRPEDNNIITNGEFGYMTLLPVQAVLQQKILMKTFSESLKRLQIYNMEKECFRMVTEGPRLVLWADNCN